MLKNRWIGTSSKTPSLTRVNQNDLKSFFQRGSGRARAAPWWSCCLQATWKVSQEPFFDSRLIVETSALFIAASFRIRHLDQISGPEVADNLMRNWAHLKCGFTKHDRVRNTGGYSGIRVWIQLSFWDSVKLASFDSASEWGVSQTGVTCLN